MRVWHAVLIGLAAVFAYEWVSTHPVQASRVKKVVGKTVRPQGIVNETNSSIPSGQTIAAGEPDIQVCSTSPDMNPGTGVYF